MKEKTLKLWHLPRVHWKFWKTILLAWMEGEPVPYGVVYLDDPDAHVSRMGNGPIVAVVLRMRDGSVKREYMESGLAELLVSAIPLSDPGVASCHIAYSELRQ